MAALKGRDLLSLADLTSDEVQELLLLAAQLKSGQVNIRTNKVWGLLFYKASTRTRVSFSVALEKGWMVMKIILVGPLFQVF